MDTMNEETLAVFLRDNGYCVLTNEDGSEKIDPDGKLIVCQVGSEQLFPVPNWPAIRHLYDLDKPETFVDPDIDHGTIDEVVEEPMQYENESLQQSDMPGEEIDKSEIVWMGQRSRACLEASRALIELLGTPKYQELMNDKGIVKLKVWEKVGADIQARGFRVANSIKEVGLRTFQKWRNMERAYWAYKRNPEEHSDERRKKKPVLFDCMDPVMKKLSKFAEKEIPPKPSSLKAGRETEISFVKALLKILVSNKYPEFYKSGGKSMKVWDKICEDLQDEGFEIYGKSPREQRHKMYQKWRSMEKKFHKYQLQRQQGKGRPLCHELLSKVMYKCLISKRTKFFDEKQLEEFSDSDENCQLESTDHDYGVRKKSQVDELTEDNSNTFSSEEIVSALATTNEALAMSTDTLLQLKAVHETSLQVQRDQFLQIRSLLEAQIHEQKRLNSLFSEYVVNRSKKAKTGSSRTKLS